MGFSPQAKRAIELFFILGIAWVFYALDGSVISVLITNENFLKTFHVDANRLGDFSFFPSIGAIIITAGVGGLINRFFGRRRSFQIATSLVIFGVILQTFTNNWGAVLAGRVIMGMGGDLNGLCLGLYVTEIAPRKVRGRALSLVQQFMGNFITIAGSWIAYGISNLPQDRAYSWKIANSLQFVPGALFLILAFRLPESPRWLARQNPDDDSKIIKALSSIRALPEDNPTIVAEAKEIRDYDNWFLTNGSVKPWNVFQSRRLFIRVCHAMVPFIATQFGGNGLINVYAAIIYQHLGLNTQHKALLFNSCLAILYAAAALGCSYFIEKLGRRPCLVWGQLANTVCLAVIAGLSLKYEGTNAVANGFIVAFIVLATCNFWLFTAAPTSVYVVEILPSQARELGTTMANLIPLGIGIALGQKWPLATEKLGAKSYLILLCTSAFAFVLEYLVIVEPKGLSIEHIDALFGETDKVEEIRHEYQVQKSEQGEAQGDFQGTQLHTEEKIINSTNHIESTSASSNV